MSEDERAVAGSVGPLGPLEVDFDLDLLAPGVGTGKLGGNATPSAVVTESRGNSGTVALKSIKSNGFAGKNSTRERLKQELKCLRETVSTLETQLTSLQNSHTAQATHDTVDAPMWRRIATRQVERRLVAEVENARLKAVLEVQIQVAKNFEQMIRKRSNEVILGLYEGTNGSRKRCRFEDEFSVVYKQFLEEAESAYAIVDKVYDENGLSEAYDESVRGLTTKTRSSGGEEHVYFEFLYVAAMPFPFKRAQHAFWKANIREYLNEKRRIQNSRQESDRLGVRIVYTGSHALTCTIVMRQYMESERMVLVWRAVTRAPSASQIYADETGWTVVKRNPMTRNSESVVIQTCSQLVPRWLDSDLTLSQVGSRLIQAGELAKLVVGCIEAEMTSIIEDAENLLLDEAIGSRTDLIF
ncbi:hypothetical protein Poli38472_004987 [Pythium oligandrum]|uniref:Uncharacterized protein n=1 Tax=Pythium oligandrum TaxID=41045 RepID=A0A8K1CC33_PYTOL|nr:hypothetical protein Poli38472_004987 [Pythium oligandrum]|eukprot:TMW59918.1 hypothetical protein Poli38472_004987 [Pythium oligandrum]